MVKKAAYAVRCAVKIGWENGVVKSLVHAAKVEKDFGFRNFDFGIFPQLCNLCVNLDCL